MLCVWSLEEKEKEHGRVKGGEGGREEREKLELQRQFRLIIHLTSYLFKAPRIAAAEKDSIGCWSENV